MRNRILFSTLIVLTLTACSQGARLQPPDAYPGPGAAGVTTCDNIIKENPMKPAFKGMELYSWLTDDGQWVFNILYGTNRLKTIQEVKSTELDGATVRNCLCAMPDGETIFWMDTAQDGNSGEMRSLPLPPGDMVKEIMVHAEECMVNFNSPQ